MWSDQDEQAYQKLIEDAGGDEAITMEALRDALDSLARRGILDKVEDNSYKMGRSRPSPESQSDSAQWNALRSLRSSEEQT